MDSQKRGRKEVAPAQIRADRISAFMKREGLTQYDLAKKIGTQQQNISRMMNTKKVSETIIQSIIDIYPEYRKEWFFGFDDIPTKSDWFESQRKSRIALLEGQAQAELLAVGTRSFAELNGYMVSIASPGETLKDCLSSAYKIEKDSRIIVLSVEEMNSFENLLCDLTEQAFKILIQRKGRCNKWLIFNRAMIKTAN